MDRLGPVVLFFFFFKIKKDESSEIEKNWENINRISTAIWDWMNSKQTGDGLIGLFNRLE
jgi:hypothetical protein